MDALEGLLDPPQEASSAFSGLGLLNTASDDVLALSDGGGFLSPAPVESPVAAALDGASGGDADEGTACRLVGRFSPVSGSFRICEGGRKISFESSKHLPRQLAVSLEIPTRAVLACTSEGSVLSLGVQGMAGRGIAFEYNSAADCFEAAGALAQAGLMDDDVLSDSEEQDDIGMEGIACAVLDEVVLASRFSFAFDVTGCNLVAWERCHRVDDAEGQAPARRSAGIMYVCEGGLIFLPDRHCKGGSRNSLTTAASIFEKGDVERVNLLFGGLQVVGLRVGARRASTTRFQIGLARDWEALAHAVHHLVADRRLEEGKDDQEYDGGAEAAAREAAEEARGREWIRQLQGRTGADLRGDQHLLAAVSGRERPSEGAWGDEVPFRSAASGGAGVPQNAREILWLKLSRADELKARYPAGYARGLLKPPVGGVHRDPEIVKAEAEIDKDVNRTFTREDLRDCLRAVGKREGSNRGAEWFTPKLRRVLLAYAQHNRSVGYCQSLNYLGGIVVVVVDAEEDCFWLLSAILEFLLPKTYYGDLSGVMLDVEALTALLERNLRAVKERLEMTHLPLTSFAAQWFMCAYVNVLSGASVIRVWDCLLMEGVVVLFRVALALLKAIEGELGMATEMEDAVAALQRARTLEIETVLQIAHSCFGSGVVDLSDLMQLRSQAMSAMSKKR